MRRVTLRGTEVETSALGFGSSGGRISDRERLRLYHLVFDHGITHFDTARAYGVGGAEGLLGKFLAGRRDQVTVTTKLGILPPSSWALLRTARSAARIAERIIPAAGTRAKQAAGNRLLTGKRFSIDDARKSLETSLRQLGTDYVDFLLLHECDPEDLYEDLISFLDERVRAGQVRFTGIATGPDSTAAIAHQRSPFPTIVQVGNSAVTPNLQGLHVEDRAVITHSPFGPGLARIRSVLSSSPSLQSRWSRELQADFSDPRTLSGWMLSYALWHNREGIVLFYSQREDHIVADAANAAGQPFSDLSLVTFARLIQDLGSSI
jgi:aryl-alcohol dehydrogenase-like predicted oxidoreductase